MPLTPLKTCQQVNYPRLAGRALKALLLAGALSATTLGGCGPTFDSRTLDSALDSGDLDGAACDDAREDCDSQVRR